MVVEHVRHMHGVQLQVENFERSSSIGAKSSSISRNSRVHPLNKTPYSLFFALFRFRLLVVVAELLRASLALLVGGLCSNGGRGEAQLASHARHARPMRSPPPLATHHSLALSSSASQSSSSLASSSSSLASSSSSFGGRGGRKSLARRSAICQPTRAPPATHVARVLVKHAVVVVIVAVVAVVLVAAGVALVRLALLVLLGGWAGSRA